MNALRDLEYVKTLKGNLRLSFESPQGKEIMEFLEDLCGWYDLAETDPDKILMAHGKRQVLATIKTLLKLKPEEIVALTQEDI